MRNGREREGGGVRNSWKEEKGGGKEKRGKEEDSRQVVAVLRRKMDLILFFETIHILHV